MQIISGTLHLIIRIISTEQLWPQMNRNSQPTRMILSNVLSFYFDDYKEVIDYCATIHNFVTHGWNKRMLCSAIDRNRSKLLNFKTKKHNICRMNRWDQRSRGLFWTYRDNRSVVRVDEDHLIYELIRSSSCMQLFKDHKRKYFILKSR